MKKKKAQIEKGGKLPRAFYMWLILDTFRWDFILNIFCILVISVLNYSSSYFIQKIFAIQYIDITQEEKVKLFGMYIALMIAFKTVLIIANNQLGYLMMMLGTKTFFATSHLIIKKTMHTSFIQSDKFNIGEIINLGIFFYLIYLKIVNFDSLFFN